MQRPTPNDITSYPEDAMLTAPEVAKYLRLGKDAAYALMTAEGFPAVRFGNQWRIPFWGLKTWVARQAHCSYPHAAEGPANITQLRH